MCIGEMSDAFLIASSYGISRNLYIFLLYVTFQRATQAVPDSSGAEVPWMVAAVWQPAAVGQPCPICPEYRGPQWRMRCEKHWTRHYWAKSWRSKADGDADTHGLLMTATSWESQNLPTTFSTLPLIRCLRFCRALHALFGWRDTLTLLSVPGKHCVVPSPALLSL